MLFCWPEEGPHVFLEAYLVGSTVVDPSDALEAFFYRVSFFLGLADLGHTIAFAIDLSANIYRNPNTSVIQNLL